jgi:hypothetical protein
MRLDLVGYRTEVKGDIAVRQLTPAELLELSRVSSRASTAFDLYQTPRNHSSQRSAAPAALRCTP